MTPTKQMITSNQAPKAIGPYSAAVKIGPFLFTAGQLGLDPATGDFVPGGVEAETRRSLQNIQALLEAAGADMKHVIKTTVFLRDMGEFAQMNAVYATFFSEEPPARSTVQVARLPKDGAVEIEAIAYLP